MSNIFCVNLDKIITSIIYEASITEWIQAIGVLLAIPATVWGVFKLFKKNKEHEQTINALEQIVKEQNDVVKQLKEHVHYMDKQSEHHQYLASLMLNSNKLLEKQFELQTDALFHNKDVEKQKIDIEKQKRINAIKPHFITDTSGSGMNDFFINLINRGGDALNVRIKDVKAEFINFSSLSSNLRVEKANIVEIKGRVSAQDGSINPKSVSFTIKLIFSDVDKNEYYQLINREKTGRYIVSEPIAVSDEI